MSIPGNFLRDNSFMNPNTEIKIIRVGEPEIPFEHFDSPVVSLTEEEINLIAKSAKKAVKEMKEFLEE